MADDSLKVIEEYPDISFIDHYTVERLETEMVEWYKEKKKELTGEETILGKADDRRLILQTGAYFIFQGYMFSDNAGKMGLLKYSRGHFLENLGALKKVSRKEASGATTTIQFSISEARNTTIGIPKGTRLTAGAGVYFTTNEYCEIKPGETQTEIKAVCVTMGDIGNKYDIGDINIIVDTVPYIDTGKNITRPENGADMEDDESLRKRIYIAPSAYSTAGSEEAYRYFVKEFNPDISDVQVTNPSPCITRIRYLLKDGLIPGSESMEGLKEYLSQPSIKPITDKIEILAPEIELYSLNLTYYINNSDRNRAELIQSDVYKAIKEYELWQITKMGRDINPDELVKRVIAAGAKRIEVKSPVFKTIKEECVASLTTETISYGGIEDD